MTFLKVPAFTELPPLFVAVDQSNRACCIDACENPPKSGGLCSKHHTRLLRHGDPLAEPVRPKMRRDEMGNRYGRLVVIGTAETYNAKGRSLCRCDCGTEKVVDGSNLRRGHTRSCGCARYETAAHETTCRTRDQAL